MINAVWIAVILALSTLASEDLTCITAGQLVSRGQLHWSIAVFACFVGVYLGDLGLWLLGRTLGRRVLTWRWIAKRAPAETIDRLSRSFESRGAAAIFAARFLPGARLPLYVAAGILNKNAGRFALWTFVAAIIWTPAVVLLVAAMGDSFVRPFRSFLGTGWLAIVCAIFVAYLLLRFISMLLSPIGRAKLIARISKIWRWEFWPMWLFYLPLIPWIVALSIRHRGFATISAANPGMPEGGFIGESKFDILSSLHSPHVSPSALVKPGEPRSRLARLQQIITDNAWTFPLILKPDVGQRGAGVRLIADTDSAAVYLAAYASPILVQPYHPGPFEAGIFYYRHPLEPTGHIFTITDKVFSELIGDGRSTFEQLIWTHPRYRMQARKFLARHKDQLHRVPPAGERIRLAIAGNHCQGTMFRDGQYLWTPALDGKIDEIAKTFDGFFFGRFDVRYSNIEAFKAGDDLVVVELNGVTSESTNIYDPSRSLIQAYRTLYRQWQLLFQIGSANRRLATGSLATTLDLLCTVITATSAPRPSPQSD